MRRQSLKLAGLTLTVLSAVAVAATAQEPQPRPAEPRERAFTFSFGQGDEGFTVMRRGRLGVLVDLTPDPARDSVGARVAGVTPGGPADRAQVHTGDIVVRFNGTRLAGAGASADVPDDQSRPGMRLIEIASRLDQGDTVRLELRRDNRPLTVTFQAGESDADVMVNRFREAMPRMMGDMIPKIQMTPFDGGNGGRVEVRIGGPLADLELVKVNAGLAEYFGTSEGLLVVDAPSDSSLGLRAGDVILSIGGRRPTSPTHALRILGTYDPGEALTFEVMRQKHRITVNGRMPAENRRWRAIHNSLEMPGMPAMPGMTQHPNEVRIMMEEEV
ncbi:MAG: PDZ domain-containing protein [Gemmatimonadales bacterium]|jgi:S1-C subfamily serine protease